MVSGQAFNLAWMIVTMRMSGRLFFDGDQAQVVEIDVANIFDPLRSQRSKDHTKDRKA